MSANRICRTYQQSYIFSGGQMHGKIAVDAANVAHSIVQIKIIIHPQHTWRFLCDEDAFKLLFCESIVRCLGQFVNVEEEGAGREKVRTLDCIWICRFQLLPLWTTIRAYGCQSK